MRLVTRFLGFPPERWSRRKTPISAPTSTVCHERRLLLRVETKANTGWRSPYHVFFARLPDLQVGSFFPPRQRQIRCSMGRVLLPGQRSQLPLVRTPSLLAPPAVEGTAYAVAPTAPGFSTNYMSPPTPLQSPSLSPSPLQSTSSPLAWTAWGGRTASVRTLVESAPGTSHAHCCLRPHCAPPRTHGLG